MKKRVVPLAAISLIAVLTLLVVGAFRSTGKLTGPPSAAAQNPNDPLKNIRFTVYDVALYPQEFEIDAGRVAIGFDDRTGKNSGFVVQRINGNSEEVAQINFPKAQWRTRGEVRLTPGRYRVFSRERPEIQSLLIVNP